MVDVHLFQGSGTGELPANASDSCVAQAFYGQGGPSIRAVVPGGEAAAGGQRATAALLKTAHS